MIIALALLVNYSVTTHPLYIKSQKRVVESKQNSEIVFVGDSSLGYGLDEVYFSKLMKGKSVSNLSLTAGGHSLAATYNMIRQTLKNNNNVKFIIIMQTPSVWSTGFVEGGYYSTLNGLNSDEVIKQHFIEDKLSQFRYKYLNINSIFETYTQKQKNKKAKNRPLRTYKNGKKDIYKEMKIDKYIHKLGKIGATKEAEIKMIDNLIKDKNIKVLYVQGTLHYQLSKKYAKNIKKQHKILKKLKNIQFIENYLYPKNYQMGTTINHVDASYKRTSTEFYFHILKKYLTIDNSLP
jgi:hypothetical protein